MDAELENYERKDDLAQKLQGYVTHEVLKEELKVYVPMATVVDAVGPLVRTAVNEEVAKDATKEQIGEFAESKVTQLMKKEHTLKRSSRNSPIDLKVLKTAANRPTMKQRKAMMENKKVMKTLRNKVMKKVKAMIKKR